MKMFNTMGFAKTGASLGRWILMAAIVTGTAGCAGVGMSEGSMLTRDVMSMKNDLDKFIGQQEAQNRKLEYALNSIDENIKGNNDIARTAIDDVEKRIRQQMTEIEKLRGEVEGLRIALGRGETSPAGAAEGFASELEGADDTLNGASATAEMATAVNQGIEARLSAGLNAFTIGNFEEASAEFNAALELGPTPDQTTEIEYWLGEIEYNNQDYPEAVAHYSKAIKSSRSHEKSWASLEKWALIKIAQGQKSEGLKYLEHIEKVYPSYSNIESVRNKIRELKAETAPATDMGVMPVAPVSPGN